MTHLCYTLEEAAEKLKLSETVLVRLSQYFKVPKAAYEEVGYLSFKGDLAFSEQDIAFFRQAKERLLTGETLDEIKQRMREEPASHWQQSIQSDVMGALAQDHHSAESDEHSAASEALEPIAPIREIQDRKPYEKAAEKSFERYKSQHHRTGLGKIFENMLKEVGSVGDKKRAGSSGVGGFRPMRSKFDRPTQDTKRVVADRVEGQTPFVRDMVLGGSEQGVKSSWEHIIQEATSQPRSMNTQLKNAAQLLRERAIGKLDREKTV